MIGPYELPAGLTWTALSEEDRAWLSRIHREPLREHFAVTLTVGIRRVSDSVIREHVDGWHPFSIVEYPSVHDLISSIRYWWGEGNGGCDCNRALFFARDGGEPGDEDRPCRHGQFQIVSPAWLRDDED